MTSTSLKHAFAQALTSYLTSAVPGLTVTAEAADPEQKKKFPSVQVLPHKMRFMPFVADAVAGDDDTMDAAVIGSNTDLIWNIGEWEGPVEIRLVAKNAPEREKYQAAILAALNGDEDRPGVTELSVPATPFYASGGPVVSTYTAKGAVFLELDEWQEEMVFEKHRFDFIEVEAQYPMLVLKRDVRNIEELILGLTENMKDDVSAIPPSDIESVSISDDGSIGQP